MNKVEHDIWSLEILTRSLVEEFVKRYAPNSSYSIRGKGVRLELIIRDNNKIYPITDIVDALDLNVTIREMNIFNNTKGLSIKDYIINRYEI